MVSPTAATHKRKKQLVGSKQVTKQNGAKVATNDDDHDDDDDDKEELAPGEDKIRISILLPKCEINTRRELAEFF